jgi:bifunctional DNA-binding transcriptional regulator/antitoxin component of YhaV-PrlF toxin-antitoxin module
MNTMTLTAKGQCTFNKELLAHLGVSAGSKIRILKLPDGGLRIERRSLDSLFGIIKTDIDASLDDIQQAIHQTYADQGAA